MHVLVEFEYACSVSAARLFWVDPRFQRGDLFLLAITCVWRLHWSVRRGTWSRVIKTGVDFIPMKFCGEPSCLALGVGALSGRGAGGRVPYCLRVIPRVQVFFAHKGCTHKSATCVSLAK